MHSRSIQRPLTYAVVFALAFTTLAGSHPAIAQPLETISSQASAGADEVFYSVELPQTVRLTDALVTDEYYGYPVIAYRFENPQIVGEFAVEGAQTAEEFLYEFNEEYGTEPMVVSALIRVPEDQLESIAANDSTSRKSATEEEGFVAPPADAEKVEAIFAARQEQVETEDAETLRAPAEWTPTYAEVDVIRLSPIKVSFNQYYAWNGQTTSTKALDNRFGMEFEVNITTAHPDYQGAARPSNCPANYKSRPFAKNYSWTWTVLMNVGNGLVDPIPAAVGAYADYNDLSDPCNKNSIAIGFRHPQKLPTGSTGTQDIRVVIVAPAGLDTAGKISGGVQTVTKTWCDDFPLLENTDCMGVAAGTAGYRPTLSASRDWTAPNKCWYSANRGLEAPVIRTCPS